MTPRREGIAVVVGALVLGVLTAARPVVDPDFPWHVRTGLEMIAQRSTLPVDLFSYSFAGAPWLYKDAVADVLFGVGYRLCGVPFVLGFKLLVAVGLGLAFQAAAPRDERSFGATMTALAAALTAFLLVERPNSLSFVGLALTLAGLERLDDAWRRADDRAAVTRAWQLALVLAVWAWLHRFALVGFAVVGVAALRAALAPRTSRLGPAPSVVGLRALFLALGAAAVLSFAHPHGIALLTTSLRSITVDASLRATTEWSALGPRALFQVFPVAAVWVVAAAGALLVSRRLHAGHVATFVLFCALTLRNARWMPYASLVAIVVLLVAGARHVTAWKRRGAVAAFVLGALAVAGSRVDDPVALGEDPRWAPAGALAFAARSELAPRVVASFDFGGYVILHGWPRFRVFVDGRNEALYPAGFVVRAVRAEGDAGTFLEQRAADGADWALATNAEDRAAFAFLTRHPEWCLVYWSEPAAVYVKRAAYPALAATRFRFVDPRAVEASVAGAAQRFAADPEALRLLEAEVRRLGDATPDGPRALGAVVAFHGALGPAHRAARDEALARLAARYPARAESLAASLERRPEAF